MENIKLPAYPHQLFPDSMGFTKLELASLMIAQGMCVDGLPADLSSTNDTAIAYASVSLAKAVLEAANQ